MSHSAAKFNSIIISDKGFDDVGFAQTAGTISAVAAGIGPWANYKGTGVAKVMLTLNSNATLKKGQPINITGLDSAYNGLTRVLAVLTSNRIIVNINLGAAPVDVTGVWDVKGGASAWDAFMPIGADLTVANVTMTFWRPGEQGGEQKSSYLSGKVYVFPAGIKTIIIATAGDVRLFRSATLRPYGLTAQ